MSNDTDGSVFIGEGTYGKVKKSGNVAIKTFEMIPSLIQEYAAGRYLARCEYIVTMLGINFVNKSITMELYDGSIRKWNPAIRKNHQKMYFINQLLKALICIHDLGMVHGDLKHGNILANWDKDGNISKLVIADLGFLAPKSYSKVQYTAPLYRDPEFEATQQHDIYSLGVIMIETFGDQIPRKVKKHKKQKIRYTQADLLPHLEKIKDDKLRSLTKRMISNDKSERPTARYLLRHIFDETIPVNKHPGFPKHPNINISTQRQGELENVFRMYSEKDVKTPGNNTIEIEIKRTKIGYLACLNYICKQGIHESQHFVYAAAILTILSSIFGDMGFGIDEACLLASVEKSTLYEILNNLLNDDNFLNSIFYTKASCF
jgi:serine/threonine protein kinase